MGARGFGGVFETVPNVYIDYGTPIVARASGNPAPSELPPGDSAFPALYITLEHRVPVASGGEIQDIRIFPVIDGVEREMITVRLYVQPYTSPANPPRRVTQNYEVGLSESIVRGINRRRKVAPSGHYFALRVDIPHNDVSVVGAYVKALPNAETLVAHVG